MEHKYQLINFDLGQGFTKNFANNFFIIEDLLRSWIILGMFQKFSVLQKPFVHPVKILEVICVIHLSIYMKILEFKCQVSV